MLVSVDVGIEEQALESRSVIIPVRLITVTKSWQIGDRSVIFRTLPFFREQVNINSSSNVHDSALTSTQLQRMSMFRSKKLDLGCFVNVKVIRDHTKRKVFAEHEPERYDHPRQ
jgi:hypothetical protein